MLTDSSADGRDLEPTPGGDPATTPAASAAAPQDRAEERSHRGFRPDVEGLRAVAILLVVLYHTHVAGASGGYVGVDVFFVISGFLITGQLVRELRAKRRVSFLAFYARRARRILPAATLVVMVTAVVSAVVLNPLAAQRALRDGVSATYFGANFHFASQGADYFNAGQSPSPFQHYWSLSVEEQFYIVWPLLLMVSSLVWLGARRTTRRRQDPDGSPVGRRRPVLVAVILVLALVAAGSLLASIRQTQPNPSWAYFSISTRAWELAVGALVALALPYTERLGPRLAIPLTWVGLASIAFAATSFSDTTAYPGSSALLPVLGAAAVITGGGLASRRWGAEALLGTPPFQRVGSWSYSWYLWHWPALVLAAALLGHALSEPQALAVAALSLVVAVISFVLVERPIRRIQVVVRRPAVGLACGGGLAALAIAIVVVSGSLVNLAIPKAAAAHVLTTSSVLTPAELRADLSAGAQTTTAPSNLQPPLATAAQSKPTIVLNSCSLQRAGVRSKPCIFGDRTSHTTVALFGDSHAAVWFPALQLISEQQHWRLVDFTKADCPPPQVNIVLGGLPYPQCNAWRHNSEQQIAALHPALVVLSGARWLVQVAQRQQGVPTGYGGAWLNGMAATFAFLHHVASHVVFISDAPTLTQWAPDCVSGHLSDVRPCAVSVSTGTLFPTVKAQELSLAKRENVSAIDPASWFCTPTVCPVIVGNILLYRDDAHMTPAWSQFIAPVLADSLLPVMNTIPTSSR